MDSLAAVSIKKIRIEKLFGMYTYDIPGAGLELGRSPILYGENGLGKTNVLKILYYFLSPAERNSHRTNLGKIKFKSVYILLSNGISLSAFRGDEKLTGPARLEIREGITDSMIAFWNYSPKSEDSIDSSLILAGMYPEFLEYTRNKTSGKRSRVFETFLMDKIRQEKNPKEGEQAFISALKKFVPPIYFLTADRVLQSDFLSDSSSTRDEVEVRPMKAESMLKIGRERALNNAISIASKTLSQVGVRAARKGSQSAHSIYLNLIRRLASGGVRNGAHVASELPDLKSELMELDSRYDRYAKYGLAPKLEGRQLVELLEEIGAGRTELASEILTPYVESLIEQANSLDKAYSVIENFVSTVNQFLFDKNLSFSVGEGVVVTNRLNEVLEPKSLSSGEQQLLLLFCHITSASGSGGIFIIDEPEISLNIKWQRKLVDALLTLDSEKNLQFLLASHSMEILSQHSDCVTPLQELIDE